MSEAISLAQAVANSLAVVDAPKPDLVIRLNHDDDEEEYEEDEAHEHSWSASEYICRGCGSDQGVEWDYTEHGTAYGRVYHYSRYGLEVDQYDSDVHDSDTDRYRCQGCGETDEDINDLFITEQDYHGQHDCYEEECECNEC